MKTISKTYSQGQQSHNYQEILKEGDLKLRLMHQAGCLRLPVLCYYRGFLEDGREVSDFNRKRASETHKGKKLSQNIIDKLTEVNTKYIFKITNEVSGEIFEVENLKKWCEERNMSYGILYRRASKPEERTRRHYKEWSIVRMIR